jgi:hypothetical protein
MPIDIYRSINALRRVRSIRRTRSATVAVLLLGFPANIHRNFLRPTCTINQTISLARRRVIHVQRVAALRDLISAV